MDAIAGSFGGELLITYVRVKYKVHRGNNLCASLVLLSHCIGVFNPEHPTWSLPPDRLPRCLKRRCTMLRTISKTKGRPSHSRIWTTVYRIEGSAAREVPPNTSSKMWGRRWYSTVFVEFVCFYKNTDYPILFANKTKKQTKGGQKKTGIFKLCNN